MAKVILTPKRAKFLVSEVLSMSKIDISLIEFLKIGQIVTDFVEEKNLSEKLFDNTRVLIDEDGCVFVAVPNEASKK